LYGQDILTNYWEELDKALSNEVGEAKLNSIQDHRHDSSGVLELANPLVRATRKGEPGDDLMEAFGEM
jgi:hypothetical protein